MHRPPFTSAGGLGLVREPDLAVGFDGLHELVGHADRHVEVGRSPRSFAWMKVSMSG
jgi:hypothetical protein